MAADEATRLSRFEPRYHLNRAFALERLGRLREAVRVYHMVLELSPEDWRPLNGLGWLHVRRRPILAARYCTAALALAPQERIIQINLKAALRGWVYRMIWIWLWGGLALGVLHWFTPWLIPVGGLLGLALACALGTSIILRLLPPGALALLQSLPQNLSMPMLGRLGLIVACAVAAALAPRPLSLTAVGSLVVLALVEWKVDFTDIDRRLLVWLGRA